MHIQEQETKSEKNHSEKTLLLTLHAVSSNTRPEVLTLAHGAAGHRQFFLVATSQRQRKDWRQKGCSNWGCTVMQLLLMAEFLKTHRGYPGVLRFNIHGENYERITIWYSMKALLFREETSNKTESWCVQRWPKGQLPLPANEILHQSLKLSGFQARHFWAPDTELVNEIMS